MIEKALQKEGFSLSEKKIDKLNTFIEKLEWYNSVHNISGARSKEAIVENIIDSIIPTQFIPQPASLLDVGTGAGFPGLLLAVIWDETKTTLAEPINKRATFLRLMSQELELPNLSVFKNKVENLKSEPFDLISSRAVTNTQLLLELTKNISSNETEYLFYKGSNIYNELETLDSQLKYDIVQKGKRNYLWIKNGT